jgi:hypothetical protein
MVIRKHRVAETSLPVDCDAPYAWATVGIAAIPNQQVAAMHGEIQDGNHPLARILLARSSRGMASPARFMLRRKAA